MKNYTRNEWETRGTNGFSNGIVPMLRVFNDTSRYVDQGGGKRKGKLHSFRVYFHIFSTRLECIFTSSPLVSSVVLGAFAIYLEPWHADVFDFVEMKKNHGYEERRGTKLHSKRVEKM